MVATVGHCAGRIAGRNIVKRAPQPELAVELAEAELDVVVDSAVEVPFFVEIGVLKLGVMNNSSHQSQGVSDKY